ncbi:MAG TPA: beta-ketoacyl synthase chain length factor [Cyclobacteriaceae bacterium]|nr:beta-ketoacyl synthase chain length factor [Cyclobacteriaceae bacterium]
MTYINGIASISPQHSFGNNPLDGIVSSLSRKFECIEPDYSPWIDPRAIRRMSKIIRTGVAAAALALKEAGIEKPDAIVTGTGLGCITDTTQFLTRLIQNKEEALNPTPFIQSTHNTVASQIALLLQCFGYNQTYSQRGFSFENALHDAMMLLEEKSAQNVLIGGIDEVTDVTVKIFDRFGFSKAVHGEGAAFFVLSDAPMNAWAEIAGMRTIYKPKESTQVTSQLKDLLEAAETRMEDIDLILLGSDDDQTRNSIINKMNVPFSPPTYSFKELCGEYSTASSFALWLGVMAIKKGFFPNRPQPEQVKKVLIYNPYFNQHHSLILLKAC